jgi:hypothetical protein
MVQPNFFSLDPLNQAWFSVLLSNPLTKVDFFNRRSYFGRHGRISSQWSFQTGAETSSNQLSSPLAGFGGAGVLLPLQSFFWSDLWVGLYVSLEKNTWSKSEKDLKTCHSFPRPRPY